MTTQWNISSPNTAIGEHFSSTGWNLGDITLAKNRLSSVRDDRKYEVDASIVLLKMASLAHGRMIILIAGLTYTLDCKDKISRKCG